MRKLHSLRKAVTDACPELARDADRLLVFIDEGSVHHRLRVPSLSHELHYQLTLMITDFSADPDTVLIPILAWLKKNQPDLPQPADGEAFTFTCDVLDNQHVDLLVTVPLTEFANVTDNQDGTVSAEHLPEPIYVGHDSERLPPDTREFDNWPESAP